MPLSAHGGHESWAAPGGAAVRFSITATPYDVIDCARTVLCCANATAALSHLPCSPDAIEEIVQQFRGWVERIEQDPAPEFLLVDRDVGRMLGGGHYEGSHL